MTLWKRVGEEDGTGPTAASAQTAIGAKNPLPPQALGTGIGRVVAPDQGVAIERIGTTAMGAGEGFKSKKTDASWRCRRGNGARPWREGS